MVKIGDIVYSKNNIPAKVIDIYIDNSYKHSKNRVKLLFDWGDVNDYSYDNVLKRNFINPVISKKNSKLWFLYKRYDGIIQRCTQKDNNKYKYYGQRGIKCLFKNFWDFYDYVKDIQGYSLALKEPNKYQIDRIDTNGNYEKGNLRFVTASENQRNRRDNYIYGIVDMYTGKLLYKGIQTDCEKFILNYTGCKTSLNISKNVLKYNIGISKGFRLKVICVDKERQTICDEALKVYLSKQKKYAYYKLIDYDRNIEKIGMAYILKNYFIDIIGKEIRILDGKNNIKTDFKKFGLNIKIDFLGYETKYFIDKLTYNLY